MKPTKRLSVGVSMAVVALLSSAMIGGTADAIAKKKCKAVNANRPTATTIIGGTPTANGLTTVPLTPPRKKTKGCVVSFDQGVSVVYSLTGSAGSLSGPATTPAGVLMLELTAPNGRTVTLSEPGDATSTLVGPLTLSTTTPTTLTNGAAPNSTPERLHSPWQGTARDNNLAFFGGVPSKGTWTFKVFNAAASNPTLGTVSVGIAQANK